MINTSSGLAGTAKYITQTSKALEAKGLYTLKNQTGELIGSTTITKKANDNNTIQAQTVRQLKDGRFIQQVRYEYGDNSVASCTIKDSKIKGKEPFISFVNKDKNGKVIHKVTRDGDRFSARINSFKPVDGQYKAVTEIYDTKPSEIKGVKNPNQYTQDFFLRTSQDGFFSKG